MNINSVSVLVIDDSQTLRSIFKNMLKHIGVRDILEAESGVDAFEILMSHNPDLIITDINMEPMNGIEFVKKMRGIEKYKNIPVIMISTEANEKNIMLAKELDVKRFISKPFSQQDLDSAIKGVMTLGGNIEDLPVDKGLEDKRILVVDDSPVILKVVEKILNNIGIANVFFAKSGREAWGEITKVNPDLILSDVHMNDVNGLELLKLIRGSKDKNISSLSFVLMSSDENISQMDEVNIYRPSAILQKPYKTSDLRECLKSVGFLN
jgi:two-component system chemotaxis response regulator CheY